MAPAAEMLFQPTQAPPRPFGSQQLYDAGPSSYYPMVTAEGTQGSHHQLPDMGPSSYPPPTGTYDEYVPKYMTYKTMIKIS
ncbi:hypothetical protein PVAP13_7NG107485 [Panicum virgatum]|uniref:Uncharacterized protein n=1 Tax=Panicum virgatum TaxID=38727 RepID=A0A8T0PZ53_PANVG|nr:hypothetical protein PVAP13_7NG107485 [Panicum virgatum]